MRNAVWSNLPVTTDLLVCGLGPAGRALTHRALAHGYSVTAVDPHPDRRWVATYGAWADELPGWVAPVGTTAVRPVAWGSRRFEIERAYVVFEGGALQDSLTVDGARVVHDHVIDIDRTTKRPASVRLSTGATLTARRVIDARGVTRSPARAEQTAYGVVVPRRSWDETLFMDWRPDNGASSDEPRSFLYAVPLGADAMLLEETCLAGRPALDGAVLRDRLLTRLRCRGIELDGSEPIERVRFPITGGRPGRDRFGAAGALLHPATGYSVATALSLSDAVVAGESIWPVSAHAVHRLRAAGLRALLALPPQDLPIFFDAFFDLPIELQRAYLSGHSDFRGTAAAMNRIFRALPWRLRRTLATAVAPIPLLPN
ncbi:lycopene cyclase [Nocardia terpenica]|uniref:lycopene cyclase family protein n=1 Tax=Nocardia terpenica TaxID=455432 RepID=UPI002FE2E22D